MVAGAKAGMYQKGNLARASTPCAPVSMEILVIKNAIAAVVRISSRPKVFQIVASFNAYFFFC